jgi:hypothetical protein
MSRMLTAAGGLIALALATLFITAAAPGAGTPTYLDPHASSTAGSTTCSGG